jgi:hypothetical protein
MKTFLFLLVAFSASLFAETVSKNSAPFAFPSLLGARDAYSVQNKNMSFSYGIRSGNRAVIALSWSLPGKVETGTICIFNLAGTKLKTFSLVKHQGMVNWDISGNRKPANGVYFATLASGTQKKNLQLLLSR